jgi:hypothetical protein
MQYRSLFLASMAALLVILSVSSCRKTIIVGSKPIISLVAGTDYIMGDSTLIQDKKYMFKVNTTNAEDKSKNTSFEVVRTYSGASDTTVYYQDLKGAEQLDFSYLHTFTTLKKIGTERFTLTVKNEHGIVNQKILIFTVK